MKCAAVNPSHSPLSISLDKHNIISTAGLRSGTLVVRSSSPGGVRIAADRRTCYRLRLSELDALFIGFGRRSVGRWARQKKTVCRLVDVWWLFTGEAAVARWTDWRSVREHVCSGNTFAMSVFFWPLFRGQCTEWRFHNERCCRHVQGLRNDEYKQMQVVWVVISFH